MSEVLIDPGATTPIATDKVGDKHYQAVKITLGPESTDNGLLSSTNPMPITGSISPVGVSSVPAITVASMPGINVSSIVSIGVSSLPSVTVGAMPGVNVSSIAAVGVSSVPALVAGTAMVGVVNGQGYRAIAASSTATLGSTGDYLNFLVISPTTISPGQVVLKDIGAVTTATTVFAGGVSSVPSLVPFSVPIMAKSLNAAWQITTSTNVNVWAAGTFT